MSIFRNRGYNVGSRTNRLILLCNLNVKYFVIIACAIRNVKSLLWAYDTLQIIFILKLVLCTIVVNVCMYTF